MELCLKNDIQVEQFTNTQDGVKFLKKLVLSLQKKENHQTGVSYRIITDRTRKEGDIWNQKAGEEFIKEALSLNVPVHLLKVFHKDITMEECKFYALFFVAYQLGPLSIHTGNTGPSE